MKQSKNQWINDICIVGRTRVRSHKDHCNAQLNVRVTVAMTLCNIAINAAFFHFVRIFCFNYYVIDRYSTDRRFKLERKNYKIVLKELC